MSTRDERREWQEFRERYAFKPSRANFIKAWRDMYGVDPAQKDVDDYMSELERLKGKTGRKQKLKPVVLTCRYEWDMGHRIPNHDGKCRRLHGHRYVLELDVSGQLHMSGAAEGMVLDFGHVKGLIEGAIGHWDHRTMLQRTDSMLVLDNNDLKPSDEDEDRFGIIRVEFVPTAENMAREVLRLMSAGGLNVTRVRIYETPNGWAEARP